MKIVSCYIENFGKLSDFSYDFNDGLNVISHENGWGKSTFMAFIKCMCYGLVGDGKRNLMESERKRYTPWQGGVFGGRLRFEIDGSEYEIIRKWGKKVQEDECLIIDCRTNLPADRFIMAAAGNAGSLGRQLFGIDEDSFARSAFIAQGDVPGGVTSDISAKISNLADNTNDMGNFEVAMETFKNTLNAMSETRATGVLSSQKAEINKLKGDILMEDSLTAGLKDLEERIEDAKTEISGLNEKNAMLGKKLDEMTAWQDAQVMRERYKLYDKAMCEAKEAYEDADRDARNAKEDDITEVRMPGLLIVGIVLAVLGAIMAVVGLIMHGDDRTFMIIGAVTLAVGAGLLIAGIVIFGRAKAMKAEIHEACVAAEARLDNAYAAYKAAQKKLDDYTREYGTEFLNANDGKGFTDESGRSFSSAAEINDEMRQCSAQIERLRGFIASYASQADDKQEMLEALREKKARLAELEEEFEAGRVKVRRLELARDLLAQAKNNMTSKYIDPLSERFAHYFKTITGDSAESYTIDAQNNISIDDKGSRHESFTLSTGLKDAVGFCLRMALVDAMYQEQKPPIILDDAFANMDDKNYKGAIRVLAEVGQTYQVIYFTCHNMV